ncbi:hypothetical protein D1AOALGA4SA_9885 [Olavius algarvensis Delta 1 endosymbiont]|nr:hypothetical protein D1AOALGA4SA_9885 [Olavius algarvensis Delta 1 endosymbiont]
MIPCSIFDIRFFEVSFIDQTGRSFGQRQRSSETTLKANRRTAEYRMSNVEGWNRFAQSF